PEGSPVEPVCGGALRLNARHLTTSPNNKGLTLCQAATAKPGSTLRQAVPAYPLFKGFLFLTINHGAHRGHGNMKNSRRDAETRGGF
ncbi:MAG: hypothetical protein LBI02_05185, partial [Opitutaceae bacterium]|nr:hypothetical protein [Opitutaceae bacterium]